MLRISREVDNYGHLYIVWNPKAKAMGCYDMEHEEFRDVAPFDDFLNNIETWIGRIVSGDL